MKKRKRNVNQLTIAISITILLIISSILLNLVNIHKNEVCINNKCFQVRMATTEAERQQGLMNVSKLDENKGMLFIFQEEDINPFWMKNTLIPLDMIWINSSLDIVFIRQNALPCNETCEIIIPNEKALYTLEINANLTEKYNIKLGDKVKINI